MTIKNIGAFNRWIDISVSKIIPELVTKFQKKLTIDLFRRIVQKSPVGNPSLWGPNSLPPPPGYVGGRFRANWQITISTPAVGEVPGLEAPDALLLFPELGNFQTVWITNNVPYADRLENGWSTQAPLGIVAISILEVSTFDG